jgi:carbonic anhydrase
METPVAAEFKPGGRAREAVRLFRHPRGPTVRETKAILVALTKEVRDAMTPDRVMERVKAGNRRFRSGQPRPRDFRAELQVVAAGQYPAAVLLSCIDSRVPAELILDLGLGDVFNCRVAGNIISPDVLGSLEYATREAGAKLVLVLGHSGCGAVQGAIAGITLGHLTQMLERFRPIIDATEYRGDRTAMNPAFVDAVARTCVERMVREIRSGSSVIAGLEAAGVARVAGAFYQLSSGMVEFLDEPRPA